MAVETPDPLAEAVEAEAADETQASAPELEAPPPGSDPVPIGDVDPTEALTMALRATADQFAPAWEISDGEVSQVAGAWAAVLKRYLPSLLEKHGELVAACYVTVIIVYPRAGKPLRPDAPAPPVESPDDKTETETG